MNQLLRQGCMALGILSACSSLAAQELHVGFVSTDRIFKESKVAELAQVKIKQDFSKAERKLSERDAELKSLTGKLERDAPSLSESKRTSQQKTLLDMERDLDRRRRTFHEELTTRKNDEFQQVLEHVNKVVKEIAVNENYDLIVQDAVYVNSKLDITDKVIEVLNAAITP